MTFESNPTHYTHSHNGAAFNVWNYIDQQEHEAAKLRSFGKGRIHTKPNMAKRVVWSVIFGGMAILGLALFAAFLGWAHALIVYVAGM